MREADRLATLHGLVELRSLQVRAAERLASRAAVDRAAAADRAERGSAMLAADEAQWHTLAATGRFDPHAAGRWARAICEGIARGQEYAAALDAACTHEADARIQWHQALARADTAEARLDDAARDARRRDDEAALNRASERHMASWGRAG